MAEKIIVVTGASSGIGAALATLLAARGDTVVLVARRDDALARIAEQCGGQAVPVTADMTRRPDVQRVVAETLERFGCVDVWVNNVGQGISRMPSELTDDDIDSMMRANVKSALYSMQEILPHFTSRNAGQIVNVSSMLGRIPFAVVRAAYIGAKHYLNALTATFRAELRETHPGIVISLVSPGVVRTDFGLNALHGGVDSRALPGSQSAEEVAAVIADVIDGHRIDVYTRPGSRDRVLSYYGSLGEDA